MPSARSDSIGRSQVLAQEIYQKSKTRKPQNASTYDSLFHLTNHHSHPRGHIVSVLAHNVCFYTCIRQVHRPRELLHLRQWDTLVALFWLQLSILKHIFSKNLTSKLHWAICAVNLTARFGHSCTLLARKGQRGVLIQFCIVRHPVHRSISSIYTSPTWQTSNSRCIHDNLCCNNRTYTSKTNHVTISYDKWNKHKIEYVID